MNTRTKIGRELLKLYYEAKTWVAFERGSSPEPTIIAAEMLGCMLFETSANGLDMAADTKPLPIQATDEMETVLLRRQSGNAQG